MLYMKIYVFKGANAIFEVNFGIGLGPHEIQKILVPGKGRGGGVGLYFVGTQSNSKIYLKNSISTLENIYFHI